jgi:hypothetical protein
LAAGMLEFKRFDAKTSQANRANWLAQVDASDGFRLDVNQLFNWVDEHINPDRDGAVAYGVFDKASDKCRAICRIVLVSRLVWIRQLDIELEPDLSYWLATKRGLGGDQAVLDIFVESIKGVLTLKVEKKALNFKIYGRANRHLQFLRLVSKKFEENLTKLNLRSCKMQGRWLAIEWEDK